MKDMMTYDDLFIKLPNKYRENYDEIKKEYFGTFDYNRYEKNLESIFSEMFGEVRNWKISMIEGGSDKYPFSYEGQDILITKNNINKIGIKGINGYVKWVGVSLSIGVQGPQGSVGPSGTYGITETDGVELVKFDFEKWFELV